MKRIVTSSEMKEFDRHTISNHHIPALVLMERAALFCADMAALGRAPGSRMLVVCGSGNNGGDGMAIARMLFLRGYRADIYFCGKEEHMTPETRLQLNIAKSYGVTLVNNPVWGEYTTIIDALFGVGLNRPVEGIYQTVLKKMNEALAWKVAVDIPSGVNADTGAVMGIAFSADLTLTFGFRKRGMCLYPGRTLCGKIHVADIGIYPPEDTIQNTWHLDYEDLYEMPQRLPHGNKGTFGKVLVAGGQKGMCGAVYFAAAAALATGAGMVCAYTCEENLRPLQTRLPEAMVSVDWREEERNRLWNWCDVLVIGPGMGTSEESRERTQWFLARAEKEKKTVILDADGLNLLAENPSWKQYLGPHVTITPHMGEMSRLCQKPVARIKEEPAETAFAYAAETGVICVLKDACTLVCDKTGELYFNLNGNSGMATAGSGDVLSGILGGMKCLYESTRATPAYQAAFGVWLHGKSGDYAAKKKGMHSLKARDLIRCLPAALSGKEEIL